MAGASDEARRRMRDAVQETLTVIANDLLGRAQRIAPLEEGTLAASGTVSDVEEVGDRLEVTVSFNTPYAARQHEELTWQHDEGRQAKYLEAPLLELTPRYEKALGDAARRAL